MPKTTKIIGKEYPAFAGITQPGIKKWAAAADLLSPPDSRQHFADIEQLA